MGVIKNLMVRIGADARGLVKGMKVSSDATAQASENVKKSTTDLKKSTRQNFADARNSIRAYSDSIAKLKRTHQHASQSIPVLKDKLSQMESVYRSVKTATSGLDLSKPLETQIADAENNLIKIEAKAKKVEKQIAALGNSRTRGSSAKMESLQSELNTLGVKSKYAQMRLEHLNQVADSLGTENIRFASDAGLKELQTDIAVVRNQLLTTQNVANETGQKLRAMGVAPTLKMTLREVGKEAAAAAGGGMKKLWTSIRNVAGNAAKGIASLPGKLLGVGKSAADGSSGLNKMAKSIRNIGIASLTLRVAGAMFGQLRSIINDYISQNDTLSATVKSLKNQMGEALAPAINLVMMALERLMPIVTAVANAIDAIFTTLFGNIAATTAGIRASASAAGGALDRLNTYGFDQITKVQESSSGGGSGSSGPDSEKQEQSAIIQKLTGWIGELKKAFQEGDWIGVGEILGNGVNEALGYVAGYDFGPKAKELVENIATTIGSFVGTVDWGGILSGLTDAITYVVDTCSGWMADTDWMNLGDSIAVLVENGFYVDWKGLARSIFRFLGSALGAAVSTVYGFISEIAGTIGDYFTEKIEEAGGEVAQGLLDGIVDGLANIGSWIKDNILDPFVEGFNDTFEIHSPSKVMQRLAKFLVDGLLKGLSENWEKIQETIGGWASDIEETFSHAWGVCGETVSQKWAEISGIVKTKAGEVFHTTSEKFGAAEGAISSALSGARKTASEEMTSLRSEASKEWETMKEDASKAAMEMASTVPGGFEDMKKGVVDVFGGMYSGAKTWMNTMIGGIERMINSIIAGMNSLIAKFNNNSIMSLVEKFTGVKVSIASLPGVTLPRLAKGTIVDGPTAAIVGESGKEAVMPLENHTGWIDNLAERISSYRGDGANTPMVIQIYLGKNRKLANCVIEDINEITKATGVCPIYV